MPAQTAVPCPQTACPQTKHYEHHREEQLQYRNREFDLYAPCSHSSDLNDQIYFDLSKGCQIKKRPNSDEKDGNKQTKRILIGSSIGRVQPYIQVDIQIDKIFIDVK